MKLCIFTMIVVAGQALLSSCAAEPKTTASSTPAVISADAGRDQLYDPGAANPASHAPNAADPNLQSLRSQ